MAESEKLSGFKLVRHTLVWVRPECREAVAVQIMDDAMRACVAAWLAADRPLVVSRQPYGCAADTIATGLALPPAQGRHRIALAVAVNDIHGYAPPLRLSDAIAHAPVEWRTSLAELDFAAAKIELELRVFGSLAWQMLSGQSYLTPQSDIDLLWRPLSPVQLEQGVALLARWERASGLRADGEMLFGTNGAVSWREWLTLKSGSDRRVLVKRACSAELVDACELMELLG